MSVDAPALPRGLTTAEAAARRAAHGPNVLTPPPRRPWWRDYLAKFDDPVIRILMVAAVVAVGVGAVDGHYAEGVGIVLAILLATALAFWNEHKAGRAFDVLARADDDTPVKALRDGHYEATPRRDVVVGDLLFLEAGEEVPADGTLVEAVGLLVDEGRLTGESKPARKRTDSSAELGVRSAESGAASANPTPDELRTPNSALPTGQGSAYPPGRLFRGTAVADGHAGYLVTAVGDATEIGRTLRASVADPGHDTPLTRQLAALSKVIGVVGFTAAGLTFAALVGRGVLAGELPLTAGQWLLAAAAVVGAAAGLVKVWLPTACDALDLVGVPAEPPGWVDRRPWLAFLATGVGVFAALVAGLVLAALVPANPGDWLPPGAGRQLLGHFMIAVTIVVVAVPEGLAMSVTLSLAYSMRTMTAQNTLVRRLHACETVGAATVICSDKTGTLTLNAMRVAEGRFAGVAGPGLPADPTVRAMLVEAVAGNTTAHLGRADDGGPRAVGNPTEGALLLWLDAAGEDYRAARGRFTIVRRWPFGSERKLMATAGEGAGGSVLHVKGAPEVLLDRSAARLTAAGPVPLADSDRATVTDALAGYQARGMRTLGFAYRPDPPAGDDVGELARGLVWVGLVAIADPVRADAPAAVAACRRAGIGVKIVTGDTAGTAAEIGRQVGLDPGAALTGAEFAALSDEDAGAAAEKLAILSRARPDDKLRLVRLLMARGQVVAVTGDGVNDGPALNFADVGLAMGKAGTAVAKEASDIVILDDSLASVVTAVKWGRGLYENIQRFLLFQLTINAAALGLAVLGPFLGYELPLTVLQMLWVNLIMDTFAALALATEPPHPGVLRRPPRSPAAFIVTRPMALAIAGGGVAFIGALLVLLVWLGDAGLGQGDAPTRAGTVVFTVFVLLQFWNLFNAKMLGRRGSVFATLGRNPRFLLIAAVILVGQVLIVQFGGTAFRTVPLSLADWLILLGTTSAVLWAGELLRLAGRRPPSPTR